MYQCILNVPLWNDWSKVTYSQVHGSPVLKTLLLQVSSELLRQDSQSSYSFGKIQNVGETELSQEKKLVFHWRKTSYFVFITKGVVKTTENPSAISRPKSW